MANEDTVEIEQPVDSISNDIMTAIRQVNGDVENESGTDNNETEETTETSEDDKQTDEDVETTETEGSDQEEEEEDSEEIDAPHSWNNEEKEMFKTLPINTQKYISERENNRDAFLNTKSQELASVKRKLDTLEEVLSPHRTKYQMSGLDDAGIIRQQFALTEALSNNPAETIAMLANQFGVDLENIGQEQEESTDPAMLKIAELEKKLLKNDETAQQERITKLRNYVNGLETETDANGTLVRPHFNELKPVMAKMVMGRIANGFDDAYDKAVKLVKDANQTNTTPTKKTVTNENSQAEKAKKAKKAAAGVTSTTSKSKPKGDLSLKDELRAVINDKQLKI